MTAILTLIYCWLQEFFFSLNDWGLVIWDSLLSVADSTLATVGTAGLTLPVIPDQYAWVLGDGHESGAGHRGERHGNPLHSANHSLCAVGLMTMTPVSVAYGWTALFAGTLWLLWRGRR
jgi:hypothetical protein